jgi:two-component system, OmpR family, phosphate regulon response regulator PhoB
MPSSTKIVAILVSNPALSSILSAMLASAPSLRVRPFESQLALTTYMRLAPVDLIVADFDGEVSADQLARDLRADTRLERHDFQLLALASKVTNQVRDASVGAGIDEIILKPMSPKYLLERVLSRLARVAARQQLRKPAPVQWPANVVPLFGRQPQPQH